MPRSVRYTKPVGDIYKTADEYRYQQAAKRRLQKQRDIQLTGRRRDSTRPVEKDL